MAELSKATNAHKLRAHLVWGERANEQDQGLLKEICHYCMVTGWNKTFDEAAVWAEQGGGEDPDLILLNSAVYFQDTNAKARNFLRIVQKIKKSRLKSRIILLLSENALADRELIINLLRVPIYNLWFLDTFDQDDVRNFLLTDRTIEEVEQYLALKGKELAYYSSLRGDKVSAVRNGGTLFKPYHVKSSIVTFWTENDTCLNYAMAILTALNLAQRGFKVALVEAMNSAPRLAGCFSIEHPFFNTSHAFTMYKQGNNDFSRNCFFNAPKYLQDPYAVREKENEEFLRFLPAELYFLPDGQKEENKESGEDGRKRENLYDSPEPVQKQWERFITQLSRIIMFEKGFHFLIFLCAGRNDYNRVILEELSYLKFMTVDLLPAGILYGLREREKGAGRTHIIGNKGIKNINQEIKAINEKPFLYPPDSLSSDFLQFVYRRDYRKISDESQAFICTLLETVGVKADRPDFEKKGWGEWLRAYIKKF